MIHYKLFSFVFLKFFLYLCIINQNDSNMNKISKTFGRTELAQMYFPRLCPEAAWHVFSKKYPIFATNIKL